MMRWRKHALAFGLLILAGAVAAAEDRIAPEAASQPAGSSNPPRSTIAYGNEAMVVTAHPLATEAALTMLRAGGNAIDAAVSAQMVLGLVEPQSSGLGGGAFLLFWDAGRQQLHSYDGRETAPTAVDENHFLLENGQAMPFFDAVVGGHGVGVPGVLRLLEDRHREQGKLPWARLFEPAIALASSGFSVSPRLHNMLLNLRDELPKGVSHQALRQYFFDDKGNPWPVGHRLKNPAYAQTLREIAAGGSQSFYLGTIAQDVVAAVQGDPLHPGKLQRSDLAKYRSLERQALCYDIREYRICSAPAPSSGGTAVLGIVAMLEQHGVNRRTDALHFTQLFAEASGLAFADRNHYIADPDFVSVPSAGLIEPAYLKQRSTLIKPGHIHLATPGSPRGSEHLVPMATTSPAQASTSHFSIVDTAGNALSMTTSIEMAFGSRILVRGFLLNNQLTDFSFTPRQGAQQVANRIQGDKRPRSSMAPTIVFRNGHPYLVIGSPGGARIIHYVAKTLVQHLLMERDVESSIEAPHVILMEPGRLELENRTTNPTLTTALEKTGYYLTKNEQTSGLNVILIDKGQLSGFADSRREGVAQGY